MTKEQLFLKYSINESHSEWDHKIDNWMSVEIYRIMHDGNLPDENNLTGIWVCDFLDKRKDMDWWVENVISKPDWGSLYLTAKRMIYRHWHLIIES